MWPSLLFFLVVSGDVSLQRIPDGGGTLPRATEPCLSPSSRLRIQSVLAGNRALLRERGLLGGRGASPLFIWPLTTAPGFSGRSYWAITNFLDHDPDYPDLLEDYMGGMRTYDTTGGYNHRGTDYFLWPFSWQLMDSDTVLVVAAAAGTIIGKDDGYPDRNCTFPSPNPNWNAVYVEHADGSVAWYGHLKAGTLIDMPVGSTVDAGDVLGVVGSSGNSSGPHLHFEVYDNNDNLIDPYTGPFNDLNAESWWLDQHAYYAPFLIRAMTHNDPPAINGWCPEDEIINQANHFQPGDRIYFSIWARDQLADAPFDLELVQPDGAQYTSWQFSGDVPHLSASWWYWYFDFPDWAPVGVWQFRATFAGDTAVHHFAVGACRDQYEAVLADWPNSSILDLIDLVLCRVALP